MERLELTPHILGADGEGWAFEEIGREGALKLIEADALPTKTVLCSNDRLAIGFLSACYEKGLTVGHAPECDLRVASMDDHPYAKFTCPALTTTAHDYDAVTRLTVETLLRLIESDGSLGERFERLIPTRLVLRASA